MEQNIPYFFIYSIIRIKQRKRSCTQTFYNRQEAVIALLKANTDKDCEFFTCLKHLLSQPRVVNLKYIVGEDYLANKLPTDQAHCELLSGWESFSREAFGKIRNLRCKHLTGNHLIFSLKT